MNVEEILKALSHEHNSNLEMMFEAILNAELSAQHYKVGEMRELSKLKKLIMKNNKGGGETFEHKVGMYSRIHSIKELSEMREMLLKSKNLSKEQRENLNAISTAIGVKRNPDYYKDKMAQGGSTTYQGGGEIGGYKIRGYETEDYDNESDVDYVWGSKSDAINSARQHWESGDYDLIVVQMIEDEDEEQIINPDTVFEITRSEGEYEFSKGGSTTYQGGGDSRTAIGHYEFENQQIDKKLRDLENINTEDAYNKSQKLREQKAINEARILHLQDKGGSTYQGGGEIKYMVWVGDMPLDINGREELTLEEAELLKREWEEKGYDDVAIDKYSKGGST